MKLQITTSKDTNIIQLAGDLDVYNIEAASEALRDKLSNKSSIELELQRVATCDLAGIQLLLATQRSVVTAGNHFCIRTSAPAIEECRRLVGLPPETLQPFIS